MTGQFNVPAPGEIISFDEAIAAERALLAGLAGAGERASARVLVWRTHRALIVPRGMPSRTGYREAVHAVSLLGWPVHERDTGGDLTPQSPGVVNVSMAFRDASPSRSIANAYRRLLEPVAGFLKQHMGIETYASAIEGSFCDGAYNLATGGRKLGGTAQRWRMSKTADGRPCADILAHIALMASMPLAGAIDAINEFYRICGIGKRISLDRHADLRALAGEERSCPAAVAHGLRAYLSEREI